MKLIYCLHSLCEKQRGGRVRGVATMPLWHGTLLAVGHALRTSGVAFPFVLERLSNTPARHQEPSPRTADSSLWLAMGARSVAARTALSVAANSTQPMMIKNDTHMFQVSCDNAPAAYLTTALLNFSS